MISEDDDNKRRRNLVTFAVLVCFTHFYGVDLSELIGKVLPLRSPVAPWKIYASGMAINLYLALRYAVRDNAKAQKEFLLHWPDRDEVRLAIREAIKHYLDGRAHAEAAALNRGRKPFTTVFSSDIEAEITPKGCEQATEILQWGAHNKAETVAPEQLREEWSRIISIGAAQRSPTVPPDAMQVHAHFTRKSNGHMFQVYAQAQYKKRSIMKTLIAMRAIAKVMLASRLALEVLLPYYLAATAAALMTVRFATTSP